jgi:transcriptional regulator with XRE-family HTH domain
MQHNRFPESLNTLRRRAQLTNRELARKARVPESLISGLQNGNRRVGETNARQIAEALELSGEQMEEFVLQAIDTSTRKLLKDAQGYPSALLNLVASQLRRAGVMPDLVTNYAVAGADQDRVTLLLADGRKALIAMSLITT